MKCEPQTIRKSLNKAYLKVKPSRKMIEAFKANLLHLFQQMDGHESEEYHKNLISKFLSDTYYSGSYHINTKGRTDLAIRNGKEAGSSAGVLIETKNPGKSTEMPTKENLNSKALQELVLYYLRERITGKNLEVKHLIITNIHEWFIFDATDFERVFAQNKSFVQQFQKFEAELLSGTKTDFFYKDIASPFIESCEQTLPFTYFDLHSYERSVKSNNSASDTKLIALCKVFSPEHLLKLPFANDSNSLDRKFYSELLHLIGLEETKDKGKKVIGRKPEGKRDAGSLLENAITILDHEDSLYDVKRSEFGFTKEEQLYHLGLDLVITWINRILFLKLLEGQLLQYHKGNPDYRFLQVEHIPTYDVLNKLFFHVLAVRASDRSPGVKEKYAHVPYLNSSLFEPSELERKTIKISNLDDAFEIPLLGSTVLKDAHGKKQSGKLNTLHYLFAFLDAYDFSSEGVEDIQEENKTLINASVLGLIFEKINGYKDGSFFTPGFITMYMCRETIRKAVVQRFNEQKNWSCKTLEDLYDKIEDKEEANGIINSLKICDPAVGSGHFLVSALNELIAIKHELKILCDRQGKRLKEYTLEVVNDELVVTDEDGELLDYRPHHTESQRVQETLFHEKQVLIENCLFGVDINPNSVKICRLRLWIELLKNAYYKPGTQELETLPNIDINIKCGNSLISRFGIDADLKEAMRKDKTFIDRYRTAVHDYRHAQSKEEKHDLEHLIEEIKTDFKTIIEKPFLSKLSKARGKVDVLKADINSKKQWGERVTKDMKTKLERAEKALTKLVATKDELTTNQMYHNAFEWRFEFPEVLNVDGDFVGFDAVIGNPPYIRQEELSEVKPYLQQHFTTYAGMADIYVYFVELGLQNLKPGGQFMYIIPNKWMKAGYGQALRHYLQQHRIGSIIDFNDLPVFTEATTYPCILQLSKTEPVSYFQAADMDTLHFPHGLAQHLQEHWLQVNATHLLPEGWTLMDAREQDLLQKIRNAGIPLKAYVDGKIFYGIKTGLNEAFVIDAATRDRLIAEDANSAEIIKPFLAGRDIKRYQTPQSDKFLILFKAGETKQWFGDLKETAAWERLFENYPAVCAYLLPFQEKAQKRYDKGNYWWELRACDYYEEFEKPKILWPGISSEINAFAFDENNYYGNDNNQLIITSDKAILGILNSNLIKFFITSIADFVRGGFIRLKISYVASVPIPPEQEDIKERIREVVAKYQQVRNEELLNEIDRLVYGLYGLTEEEIGMVEKN